jgi:hypothetical protein
MLEVSELYSDKSKIYYSTAYNLKKAISNL